VYFAKICIFLKTLIVLGNLNRVNPIKLNVMFKNLLFSAVGLCLFSSTLFAQSSVQPEKKKIKVQMYINDKLHPSNQTFTKSDQNIQIKAYDATNNKELAVTLLEASLVRNGQKIASLTLPGHGSIEKLVAKAQNNDNYVFEIKQIFELAEDFSLKPFSQKTFKVNYWFFDAQLDATKVAVGAN